MHHRHTVTGQSSHMKNLNDKLMLENEEREELGLYLFKTHARNKMVAFKRILSSEFPMRMIPLDSLETVQDDDGFDLIVKT